MVSAEFAERHHIGWDHVARMRDALRRKTGGIRRLPRP
jgi:hypothetical protein